VLSFLPGPDLPGFKKLVKDLLMSSKFLSSPLVSSRSSDLAAAEHGECVLKVTDVARNYHIYEKSQDRLKQFLWRGKRKYYRDFWALHPLSFELRRGECLGFVGRNGSGKSTLLQILAGTLNPSLGSYTISGRVAALLELGSGFNMEFSGRENVYLNASILGLSKREIDQQFSAIEEFAEIGTFMDQAVKTYSSGMYIRLAFSVAIHVHPEVLLVDEALSVGDAAFQYKCLRKIEELRSSGMSIVFVTHDTMAVKRFCTRAGWLHDGQLVAIGDAVEVTHQYEDFMRQRMKVGDDGAAKATTEVKTSSSDEQDVLNTNTVESISSHEYIKIVDSLLLDGHGSPTNGFITGANMTLQINYEVFQEIPDGYVMGAAIFRSDDLYVCGLNTALDNYEIDGRVGVHSITLEYSQLPLLAGTYYFKMGVFDSSTKVRWDFHERLCAFAVSSPYLADGVCVLDHSWKQAI
jgi:teichoic acid transport system ATP-binding protein